MDPRPRNWIGPCSSVESGASWDLDEGDLVAWVRAVRICQEACPFKSQCIDRRQELYPGKARPAGVIWAGVAYSGSGQILDAGGLRRLAAGRRDQPRQSCYEPSVHNCASSERTGS